VIPVEKSVEERWMELRLCNRSQVSDRSKGVDGRQFECADVVSSALLQCIEFRFHIEMPSLSRHPKWMDASRIFVI